MASPSSKLSSSSLIPMKNDGEFKNWAELPSELKSSILKKLRSIDILEKAQNVCKSWRRFYKEDPAIWRKIDMYNVEYTKDDIDNGYRHRCLVNMCRQAVNRSQGGLVEIDISHFCTDDLLDYIAYRTSILKRLKLVSCYRITSMGLTRALERLPSLEDLEVTYCSLSAESLVVIGLSCPNLKTLKLNRVLPRSLQFIHDDKDAQAIAETMKGLCHLQLVGNRLSDYGINDILNKCPNLEHLDLRQCENINFVENLEKRCSERIKVFRGPNDSIHDYPYGAPLMVFDTDSSDDDYDPY